MEQYCLQFGKRKHGGINSVLKKLNSKHNTGLKLALESYFTSPITSLLEESCPLMIRIIRESSPLNYRRKKNGLAYSLKAACSPDNPVNEHLFTRWLMYAYSISIVTSKTIIRQNFRIFHGWYRSNESNYEEDLPK